jgi:multiple sugar transport system permease protein
MTALRKREARSARAFLAPFLVLFLLTFLVPIGYAIYESLQKAQATGLLGLGGTRTVFAGMTNYSRALHDDAFLASIRRVLLFAAVEVPVMIVLAVALALLLDTASARWSRA